MKWGGKAAHAEEGPEQPGGQQGGQGFRVVQDPKGGRQVATRLGGSRGASGMHNTGAAAHDLALCRGLPGSQTGLEGDQELNPTN